MCICIDCLSLHALLSMTACRQDEVGTGNGVLQDPAMGFYMRHLRLAPTHSSCRSESMEAQLVRRKDHADELTRCDQWRKPPTYIPAYIGDRRTESLHPAIPACFRRCSLYWHGSGSLEKALPYLRGPVQFYPNL